MHACTAAMAAMSVLIADPTLGGSMMHHRGHRGHRGKKEDKRGDSISASSDFSVVKHLTYPEASSDICAKLWFSVPEPRGDPKYEQFVDLGNVPVTLKAQE